MSMTSSRTKSNIRRTSRPGIWMFLIRAVANGLGSAAVERGLAVLGGIDDECSALRLDRRQSAADGAADCVQGPAHLVGEWVVAAGIEQDDPQLLRAVDCAQYLVHRSRFKTDVAVGRQPRVDRDQIVRPA